MYDQNPVLDSDVFIALWKNIFFMKDYEYVCFILFSKMLWHYNCEFFFYLIFFFLFLMIIHVIVEFSFKFSAFMQWLVTYTVFLVQDIWKCSS